MEIPIKLAAVSVEDFSVVNQFGRAHLLSTARSLIVVSTFHHSRLTLLMRSSSVTPRGIGDELMVLVVSARLMLTETIIVLLGSELASIRCPRDLRV